MQRRFSVLSDEQAEQFLTHGHVVIKNCFSREAARTLTDRTFPRLGYDPNDEATWEAKRIHMPVHDRFEVKDFAPKAWAAMGDLLGGEERIKTPCTWGDGFIVNLGGPEDAETWQPPSAEVPGWHKDGDWFVHFLDSPEQGLLTIVVWSDIAPTGGGTFFACDSVPVVARFLAERFEGVRPGGFPFKEMVRECHDFIEATGEVGDVFLIHPYLLHASSQNALRVPRLITNPAVSLQEPMRFDRPDPSEFSLVEQAVLRGLGVERLSFAPASPRERVTPEREIRQKKMLEEERARLAATAAS